MWGTRKCENYHHFTTILYTIHNLILQPGCHVLRQTDQKAIIWHFSKVLCDKCRRKCTLMKFHDTEIHVIGKWRLARPPFPPSPSSSHREADHYDGGNAITIIISGDTAYHYQWPPPIQCHGTLSIHTLLAPPILLPPSQMQTRREHQRGAVFLTHTNESAKWTQGPSSFLCPTVGIALHFSLWKYFDFLRKKHYGKLSRRTLSDHFTHTHTHTHTRTVFPSTFDESPWDVCT